MSDREQLIREIAADESLLRRGLSATDVRWMIGALERLGYLVTPAESPAEAPRIASQAPEGSEATHTAELARLRQWQAEVIDLLRAAMPGSFTVQSLIRRAGVETEETPT